MTLQNIKMATAAVWLLIAGTGGIAAGTTTAGGWVALLAVALLPPTAMWFLWNDPAPTMSESISRARG